MLVTVICLNLWEEGALFDKALEFIAEKNPDILMLQEAVETPGSDSVGPEKQMLTAINKLKLFDFFAYAPTKGMVKSGQKSQYGNAIFSKWKISNQQVVFFNGGAYEDDFEYTSEKKSPDEPRNLLQCTVTLDGKTLHLANTHGVWGKTPDDNSRRLAMGNTIARHVEGLSPIILAGDFNVVRGTETVNKIEEHLLNVFGGELTTTFNLARKGSPPTGTTWLPVDMMFVSDDIRVLSKECPQVDISDHLPLVVTLDVSGN